KTGRAIAGSRDRTLRLIGIVRSRLQQHTGYRSSLDSESERLVQQALERLMPGRTSIIIAHRLSTVRTADRIFVVKDGEVVGSGTHAELLAKEEGIYRTLSDL